MSNHEPQQVRPSPTEADRLKAYRAATLLEGNTVPTRDVNYLAGVLAQAITQKAVLRIDYEPGVREIEPHAIGIGTDGQYLLRAYQLRGASASGEPENWKLFRLDRMGDLVGWGPQFTTPRPGFKKGDRAMTKGILAEL